ncbi:MAG: DoxX family protein [Phycisphaerales bacterium JB040]
MNDQPAAGSGVSKTAVAGWVAALPPVGMLAMSGAMKLAGGEQVEQGFADLGWPSSLAPALGIVELVCVALYLLPKTAVLGAILITGYLGGATSAHARLEEVELAVPVLLGVLAWVSLWLRDPRVRALAPLRS